MHVAQDDHSRVSFARIQPGRTPERSAGLWWGIAALPHAWRHLQARVAMITARTRSRRCPTVQTLVCAHAFQFYTPHAPMARRSALSRLRCEVGMAAHSRRDHRAQHLLLWLAGVQTIVVPCASLRLSGPSACPGFRHSNTGIGFTLTLQARRGATTTARSSHGHKLATATTPASLLAQQAPVDFRAFAAAAKTPWPAYR